MAKVQTLSEPIESETYLKVMDEVRQRTLDLVAGLPEQVIMRQHDPLMSPLIWDMGHVANFEELWFLQELRGLDAFDPEDNRIYNALTKPRRERSTLPLPDLETTRHYMDEIRRRVKEAVRDYDFDTGNPLAENGFIFDLVIRHEMQHQETMLITLQIMDTGLYSPPWHRDLPSGSVDRSDMIEVPGREFLMGSPWEAFAYDNERPAHTREIEPFRIARYPVSDAEYLEFMRADGYQNEEYWSPQGWQWVEESGTCTPKYWVKNGDQWYVRRFDELMPVNPDEPVMHVSYYEAEAYCNFAGKRLPTEAEWEYAASVDPETGEKRSYPWGDEYDETRANLNQTAFRPAEIGAYPDGVSPVGCHQMVGDVWEWTQTDFRGYPGFQAFPYDEYSEIFFGDEYKVLRGGAWSVHDRVISTTFRNWDYPQRRQIFAGFRCAADVD